MTIASVFRYRFFSDRTGLYLLDLNSHWWTCFVGVFNWNMKIKAYKVESEYGHKSGNVYNVLAVLGYTVSFLLSITSHVEITMDMRKKIILDIFLLGILFLIGQVLALYQTRKMDRQVDDSKKTTVKLKFRGKKSLVKLILMELCLKVLSVLLIFAFLISTEVSGFVANSAGLLLFLYGGTIIPRPFCMEDLDSIEDMKRWAVYCE